MPSGEVITLLPTPENATATNKPLCGDQQTLYQLLSVAEVLVCQLLTIKGDKSAGGGSPASQAVAPLLNICPASAVGNLAICPSAKPTPEANLESVTVPSA